MKNLLVVVVTEIDHRHDHEEVRIVEHVVKETERDLDRGSDHDNTKVPEVQHRIVLVDSMRVAEAKISIGVNIFFRYFFFLHSLEQLH